MSETPALWQAKTLIDPAFFDIDPKEIVWHGNYVKHLEVARCTPVAPTRSLAHIAVAASARLRQHPITVCRRIFTDPCNPYAREWRRSLQVRR